MNPRITQLAGAVIAIAVGVQIGDALHASRAARSSRRVGQAQKLAVDRGGGSWRSADEEIADSRWADGGPNRAARSGAGGTGTKAGTASTNGSGAATNGKNKPIELTQTVGIDLRNPYPPAPPEVQAELARVQQQGMAAMAQAQREGDSLVLCESRTGSCVARAPEGTVPSTCVTYLRNCAGDSKRLTSDEQDKLIGIGAKEKQRAHTELLSRTGSSYRSPSGLPGPGE